MLVGTGRTRSNSRLYQSFVRARLLGPWWRIFKLMTMILPQVILSKQFVHILEFAGHQRTTHLLNYPALWLIIACSQQAYLV
jgi:hypothetical protein